MVGSCLCTGTRCISRSRFIVFFFYCVFSSQRRERSLSSQQTIHQTRDSNICGQIVQVFPSGYCTAVRVDQIALYGTLANNDRLPALDFPIPWWWLNEPPAKRISSLAASSSSAKTPVGSRTPCTGGGGDKKKHRNCRCYKRIEGRIGSAAMRGAQRKNG